MPTQKPPIGGGSSANCEDRAALELAQAWARLREERDRRLMIVDENFMRHIRQHAKGQPTTLSKTQFERLLAYQQALRDLPGKTRDPTRPVWPPEPF